jgi:hypothetical protein
VFTARYALRPYIKQIRSVFKGLIFWSHNGMQSIKISRFVCFLGLFYILLLQFRKFLEPNRCFTLKMGSERVVILKFMTVLSVPVNQEHGNSTVY